MRALKNAQIPNRGRGRKELMSVPRLPGVAEAKRMVGGNVGSEVALASWTL